MYRNDNDKKLALIAAIFVMLIFTLVSCGKKMTELQGNAHDIAFRVYSHAGIDAKNMSEAEITKDEAYILGISENDFEENVEEALLCRTNELSAEESLCVIVAKNQPCAEALYTQMYKEYDWAPCDPAQTAVFMQYGKYVLLAKDSAEKARAVSSAFSEETGKNAVMRFSQNPM